MARRHALSDAQWARIADLFDQPRRKGGQWRDHRTMLDAILWIMKTGAAWRDLPERFGPWQTAYERFTRWRRDGTLDRVVARLQRDLDRDGLIDWSAFCVDATHIRATRASAGARKGGALPGRPPIAPRRVWRWGARAAVLRPSFTSSVTETVSRSVPL